jgi:hypothetical protein
MPPECIIGLRQIAEEGIKALEAKSQFFGDFIIEVVPIHTQ